MIRRTQVYGLLTTEIDTVAPVLANVLSINWTLRDNITWGSYYTAGDIFDENIVLFRNFNFMADEVYKKEFSDYQSLLMIGATERPDEIKGLLLDASSKLVEIILLSEQDALNLNSPS